MTILKHELRQNRWSFLIWTVSITLLLSVCVFLYPEMKGEMTSMNDMFASMGSFSQAFGMDRLNFGSFIGFYAVECGNILGLGGAFYACLTGASMLAKEEKNRTAEFLLSHPVSRQTIVTQKLLAMMILICTMNLIVFLVAIADTAMIHETVPWKDLLLMHSASLLMQVELGALCFGISAFLSRSSAATAIGLAILMYFLNLISNITDKAGFLKYVTPFGYCNAADIITDGHLDLSLIGIGLAITLLSIAAAYARYTRKGIC